MLTRVKIRPTMSATTEAFNSGYDQGYTKGFAAGVEHAETQATARRRSGW